MKKVLLFPDPFHVKNPTPAEQAAYMASLSLDEAFMGAIGHFVEVNALKEADYCEEIRRTIAAQQPDWVIAAGKSATACVNLHGQKKILINPAVTFDDLKNVPEAARMRTFGFFGALPEQEKSYELFQAVYPNAAWFANAPKLRLVDMKGIIHDIIEGII